MKVGANDSGNLSLKIPHCCFSPLRPIAPRFVAPSPCKTKTLVFPLTIAVPCHHLSTSGKW